MATDYYWILILLLVLLEQYAAYSESVSAVDILFASNVDIDISMSTFPCRKVRGSVLGTN